NGSILALVSVLDNGNLLARTRFWSDQAAPDSRSLAFLPRPGYNRFVSAKFPCPHSADGGLPRSGRRQPGRCTMDLHHYRLLAQLGGGVDGSAYRGRDARDDTPVEICLLSGARADDRRWPSLVTTLRRAALLDHDTALGIRELGLDHDPPYVVREWL